MKAYLLLALTPLFWAGNVVSARAIHADLDPIALAFLRWLLVLLMILPWALPRIWRSREVIRAHLPMLILLSILSVASFNTFIYMGLQDTGASNAALLQSAAPVVIVLLNSMLLRERISLRQWAGILVSLCGVAVLVSQANFTTLLALEFNRGDIWIGVAVLTWSVYSVALRWRPQALDGFTLFSVSVVIGTLALAPFGIWHLGEGVEINWGLPVVSAIIYMAIGPSILAYLFWNRGVAELGAARAGLFIHLIPVFGVLMSVLFLGESLYLFHGAGILLIFTGIYLATICRRKETAKTS
ncbi:DMT family transporter [Marinobacterium lutimaris]|uniref:Permease of the drug/metabolite transporter (DMT) superfamily n=1 Tax=Marinobacterium lutimaris TaxID=568106 RepID=A0A1H6CB83_9GAMM|nr:DMT family transporter [Marinobacterium lutimaris]SEG70239.1 Permease of the drug/metabolite transporter (DMT) superfamily [Marinobacterium lutimaris]